MPKKKRPEQNLHALWAILTLVGVMMLVFMWATSVAAQIFIPQWEEQLFLNIYGWPDLLLPFFLIVTQLGSVWLLILVAIVAWVRRKKRLALFAVVTGGLVYATVWVGKELIMRPRPDQVLSHIEVHDSLSDGFGYPSGHTALATVLAFLLWAYIPKQYRWTVVAGVVLVALSRLYLGMHFPLDVLGGFLIGGMMGALLYLPHHKKVGKPKWLYRKINL